jgi:hypothetical protein
MLKGWLAVLAVLMGMSFSFAATANSDLLHEKRWGEARKFLADGKAAEAKADFEDLLKQYPNEPDLYLFLGIACAIHKQPSSR